MGAVAGSLATGVVASKAVAPALGAAERGTKGLVGRVEEAAVAPVDAGAGLLHRAADAAVGVAKAPVQAVTGAIGMAADVAKSECLCPLQQHCTGVGWVQVRRAHGREVAARQARRWYCAWVCLLNSPALRSTLG